MAALYLSRLRSRARATANRFGESVPPGPRIDSALMRTAASGDQLEVCMTGPGLVGSANGPQVSIDGTIAPCICFEGDHLVAALPPGAGPRVRVLVTYGPLVCGDFLIRSTAGARVRWWSIRIDDRLHSSARTR